MTVSARKGKPLSFTQRISTCPTRLIIGRTRNKEKFMLKIKKIITISIALFVLIGMTGYFLLDAPVADQASNQSKEYGKYNRFVSKSLENDFRGALPKSLSDKEKVLNYSYQYQCSMFGDPRFHIQLQCQYENVEDFYAEEKRIRNLSDEHSYFDDMYEYFLISGSEQEISNALDDMTYDGVKYIFEIVVISQETRTMEYFVAYQWDGAVSDENVVAFLSRVSRFTDA